MVVDVEFQIYGYMLKFWLDIQVIYSDIWSYRCRGKLYIYVYIEVRMIIVVCILGVLDMCIYF